MEIDDFLLRLRRYDRGDQQRDHQCQDGETTPATHRALPSCGGTEVARVANARIRASSRGNVDAHVGGGDSMLALPVVSVTVTRRVPAFSAFGLTMTV